MTPEEIFWLAHDGLPRQSPGSDATLTALLQLAGPRPARPRVLDVGCGSGAATVPLAVATGGDVVAVDTHRPFLRRLRADADAAGVGDRVAAIEAPMQDLPVADASVDLLWAEGSAYLMGFDAALAAWRRLLAPGAVVVVTEAVWTSHDPAPAARAFWDAGYPGMRDTAGNIRAVEAAGWTVVATHLLPDSDWATYYDPFAARLAQVRREHPDAADTLDGLDQEITVRRDHAADYGYAAYVLRPRWPQATLTLSVPGPTLTAMTAIATLGSVVLDCRAPLPTAQFYSALLDVPVVRTDDDWVQLAPTGGVTLSFQLAPDHVPPVWPGSEHPQQFHLDVDVADLDVAEAQVLAIGARKHEVQPGTTFRVFLDPAGHPFCLCAC